jgi:hypothetical protein
MNFSGVMIWLKAAIKILNQPNKKAAGIYACGLFL